MRIGPFGVWEILIILVVALVVFGPRRLPEMAKGIGQSVREFRKGIRDMRDEFREEAASEPKPAPASGRSEDGRGEGVRTAATDRVDPAAAPRPSTPA